MELINGKANTRKLNLLQLAKSFIYYMYHFPGLLKTRFSALRNLERKPSPDSEDRHNILLEKVFRSPMLTISTRLPGSNQLVKTPENDFSKIERGLEGALKLLLCSIMPWNLGRS